MANLVRRKQVDQTEFSGFFVEVGNSNYYPIATNPSGYLDQATLAVTTGGIYSTINTVSGNLDSSISNTGSSSIIYSDGVSGALSNRLNNSGLSLSNSISSLSGYVGSVSGNLFSSTSGASGILNTKIDTLSGYSINYTNNISGALHNEIVAFPYSGAIQNIASGDSFNFSGTKIFNSPITAQRINLSGVSTPSSISIVAASGSVSIVGSGGTFMSFIETGTSNSLWAVADSAGLPMLELFDDYTLVLGHSSRPSITLSGISGYVTMPNLPTQTQTGGLPVGTLFRSGSYLMII